MGVSQEMGTTCSRYIFAALHKWHVRRTYNEWPDHIDAGYVGCLQFSRTHLVALKRHTLGDRIQSCATAKTMSGIASKLQHDREKAQGIGSNAQAVKYLGQDFEALRRNCVECGQLFRDETFEALPLSLGFNELGPNSHKVRGVTWKRPTVGYSSHHFRFLESRDFIFKHTYIF